MHQQSRPEKPQTGLNEQADEVTAQLHAKNDETLYSQAAGRSDSAREAAAWQGMHHFWKLAKERVRE